MTKRRIHLSESQLHSIIKEAIINMINEDWTGSDDALYEHIAKKMGDTMYHSIVEYENNHSNLSDKVEVQCPIKYQPDNGTLIFGMVYGWFEHEYDFVISYGVETSMLMICHMDENGKAIDKPKPLQIDIQRLNDILQKGDVNMELMKMMK